MPSFNTVSEMISGMPQYFVPEAAAGLNVTMQLELAGDGGGQWHLIVADKTLKINEGQAINPNMTLMMAASDYLAIVNGQANAMQMFMQGKVKVGGDMSLVMKMQSMFRM
jgi:putative sterol carrier protein